MEENILVFQGSNENVWKYVFHFDKAIAESVLYKYNSFEKRTVLCVSVQSGCPVGCQFCGTGKRFIRNLTSEEIVFQVKHILENKKIIPSDVNKFQIMFMSMGEPFLNYNNVSNAIKMLYVMFPNAQLLISTIAPRQINELQQFIDLSKKYNTIGLQFSIHQSTDRYRNELIPFVEKLSLNELRNYGVEWWKDTGRKPYCNYCIDGSNNTPSDFENLVNRFPPNVFCFTFSVICSANETMKDSGYRELDSIREFETMFIKNGYDTRIFDPAGQDDIGGGCGQLWYVQKYLKENG